MSRSTSKQSQLRCGTIVIVAASLGALISCGGTAADDSAGNNKTATPIKHVIVLIGENRTFDHVFGTYKPKKGQTVSNFLSKGITNADGTPGPNFAQSQQFSVNTPLPPSYFISTNQNNKMAYADLPPPELGGAPNKAISLSQLNANPTNVQPPFDNSILQSQLAANEPALEVSDLHLLRTGATGAAGTTGLDSRVRGCDHAPKRRVPAHGADAPL